MCSNNIVTRKMNTICYKDILAVKKLLNIDMYIHIYYCMYFKIKFYLINIIIFMT